MYEVSRDIASVARTIESRVLSAFATTVTQTEVAKHAGVDSAQISRFLSEPSGLNRVATILAACGLKVVPVDAATYGRETVHALLTLARDRLADAAPEDLAC